MTTRTVRDKFARLSQMATLLTLEAVSRCRGPPACCASFRSCLAACIGSSLAAWCRACLVQADRQRMLAHSQAQRVCAVRRKGQAERSHRQQRHRPNPHVGVAPAPIPASLHLHQCKIERSVLLTR
jgi:hypothetical protein